MRPFRVGGYGHGFTFTNQFSIRGLKKLFKLLKVASFCETSDDLHERHALAFLARSLAREDLPFRCGELWTYHSSSQPPRILIRPFLGLFFHIWPRHDPFCTVSPTQVSESVIGVQIEEGMLLAGKIAGAGFVFLLLATGISGPRPRPSTSGVELRKEAPGGPHPNDANRMQQSLLEKGYDRGKVDGVIGLRTRAGIRAYQKAENLPLTDRLDKQTAVRLGVSAAVREETGYERTPDKPPAGTALTKGSGRARKTPQKPIKKWIAPQG